MAIEIDTSYNWTASNNYANQITLSGSGLVYVRLRPAIDLATLRASGVPTIVYRGLTRWFSLPIWNSDDEQLFMTEPHVPSRWDGASDITAIIDGYLDTANDTKRFGLQLSWASITEGTDVIGTSSFDDPTSQVLTGTWAQYQSFSTTITFNYDVATPNLIAASDTLNMRLRRIAKVGAEAEITGEVVITGISLKYRLNKFYSST